MPEVALKSLPSALRKDPAARRDIMAEVDLVVLCLPDDAARESAALADELGADAPKLLDASTAHQGRSGMDLRFPRDGGGAGQAHRRAGKVANPGCYPTGASG